MRTVTTTQYIAFDGTPFEDATKCLAYEAERDDSALVGLTLNQVQSAIMRDSKVDGAVALADAIERIGNDITKRRLEQGDRRRKPKEAPPAGTTGEPAAQGNEPTGVSGQPTGQLPGV